MISRFRELDILDRQKLDYDLHRVDNYMRSKGYLQARHGEPRIEGLGPRRTGFPILPLPFLSSVDDTLRITVPIIDGRLYRLGDMKIEGNSIFSEQAIKAVIGLQKGEVANGEAISKALYENLKKYYGQQGFIQHTAEVTPTFKDDPQHATPSVDTSNPAKDGQRKTGQSGRRSSGVSCSASVGQVEISGIPR